MRADVIEAFTDFLAHHRRPAAPAMAIFSRDQLFRGLISLIRASVAR
jgi:hypothetical protein